MSVIAPEQEYVHRDFPRDRAKAWKENWYFNFIDRGQRAWGINHVSLERHTGKACFRAFHVVDDEIRVHSNEIPLTDDFSVLTDGKLSIEVVEPLRRFRVRFDGPTHAIDLVYEGRFEVFDYGREHSPGAGDESFAIEHYEQAMTVTGTLTTGGVARPIACLGHRDHSWGYRDESLVAGWNWIAVQFPGATLNVSEVRFDAGPPMRRGFVSEATGNTGISDVRVVTTARGDDGIPRTSTFELVDEKGRAWTLVSDRFSGLVLPIPGKGRPVVIYENFSDWTLMQTGQRGVGIDEYLADVG